MIDGRPGHLRAVLTAELLNNSTHLFEFVIISLEERLYWKTGTFEKTPQSRKGRRKISLAVMLLCVLTGAEGDTERLHSVRGRPLDSVDPAGDQAGPGGQPVSSLLKF